MRFTKLSSLMFFFLVFFSASGCRQQDDTSTVSSAKYLDINNNCGYWAARGECRANPNYMLSYCPNSCANVGTGNGLDLDTDCGYWAGKGECSRNPGYMISHCPQSCGRGYVSAPVYRYAIVDGRRYPVCTNFRQTFTYDTVGRLWGWENNMSCLLVQ